MHYIDGYYMNLNSLIILSKVIFVGITESRVYRYFCIFKSMSNGHKFCREQSEKMHQSQSFYLGSEIKIFSINFRHFLSFLFLQ